MCDININIKKNTTRRSGRITYLSSDYFFSSKVYFDTFEDSTNFINFSTREILNTNNPANLFRLRLDPRFCMV